MLKKFNISDSIVDHFDDKTVSFSSWIIMRLFSGTKRMMTDSRKHMDPSTLQTIIMLRTNNDLWDERDIQWAIDNPRHFEEISDSDSI